MGGGFVECVISDQRGPGLRIDPFGHFFDQLPIDGRRLQIVAGRQIGGKFLGRHIEQHDLNAAVLDHPPQQPFHPAPSRFQPLIERIVQDLAHQRGRFFPFEIGKPIDVLIDRVGLKIVELGRIELHLHVAVGHRVVEPRGRRFEHVVDRVERDLDRLAGQQIVARRRAAPAAVRPLKSPRMASRNGFSPLARAGVPEDCSSPKEDS